MASYAIKAVASSTLSSAKQSLGSKSDSNKINWDDFNYPPLLKVLHYDISEVDPEKKNIVRALWLSHVLICVYTLFNIINNIAIAAGTGEGGIRIMYSFMFLFSFCPIQCFLFYRGYKGVCSDQFLLTLYKWIQPLLVIAYICFAIFFFMGFNGFLVLGPLFDAGLAFQGILAIVEDILLILTAMLSIYSLVRIFTL